MAAIGFGETIGTLSTPANARNTYSSICQASAIPRDFPHRSEGEAEQDIGSPCIIGPGGGGQILPWSSPPSPPSPGGGSPQQKT